MLSDASLGRHQRTQSGHVRKAPPSPSLLLIRARCGAYYLSADERVEIITDISQPPEHKKVKVFTIKKW